jgi:hypothetical protein
VRPRSEKQTLKKEKKKRNRTLYPWGGRRFKYLLAGLRTRTA